MQAALCGLPGWGWSLSRGRASFAEHNDLLVAISCDGEVGDPYQGWDLCDDVIWSLVKEFGQPLARCGAAEAELCHPRWPFPARGRQLQSFHPLCLEVPSPSKAGRELCFGALQGAKAAQAESLLPPCSPSDNQVAGTRPDLLLLPGSSLAFP